MVGKKQFPLVNDSLYAQVIFFTQIWGMNHLFGCASSHQWNWRLLEVTDDVYMYYNFQVLSWFSCMPVEHMLNMTGIAVFQWLTF